MFNFLGYFRYLNLSFIPKMPENIEMPENKGFRYFSFFRVFSETIFYFKFELSTLTGSMYNSLKLHKIPSS